MKKIIPIVVGGIVILVGGIFIGLNQGQVIPPGQMDLIEFDSGDIQFINDNVKFTTSTDNFGRTVKTGLVIPIKYNFPVATTSGYVVQEIEKEMGMTLDGYAMCRQAEGTPEGCLAQLRADIEYNIRAFQENVKRELKELKRSEFRAELDIENL